jgi:hypothetical protein
MLLWLPSGGTATGTALSSSSPHQHNNQHHHPHHAMTTMMMDEDGNEKAAKLKRRAKARCVNLLAVASVVCTVITCMVVRIRQVSPHMRGSLLPHRSIYRLSVPIASTTTTKVAERKQNVDSSTNSNMRSLEEFAGQVTLVVNTACL